MPEDNQAKIDEEAAKILEERLKQTKITAADLPEVKKTIVEQVKAEYQLVPPGYSKTWRMHLGAAAKNLEGQSLQLRIKFNAAQKSASGTFVALWHVGAPPKTKNLWRSEPMSLAPDTFHEITIPPGLLDSDGVLT